MKATIRDAVLWYGGLERVTSFTILQARLIKKTEKLAAQIAADNPDLVQFPDAAPPLYTLNRPLGPEATMLFEELQNFSL